VFGVAQGITSINFDDVVGGTSGFKITGETFFNDQTGLSVSNAGDVNGDGFDDVIVGAYNITPLSMPPLRLLGTV